MKAYKSISAQLKDEQKDDTRKDWTFEDYHKKDPTALKEMKANDPERYKVLLDAYKK